MTVRILRIVARMNVGGPAVEISALMRGLPPETFEQLLLTGYCSADEADYLETFQCDFPYQRITGLGRSLRPGEDLRALWSIMKLIRSLKPDVIHTHTAKAGTLGRVAAMLTRSSAARVHTFHGHVLHGYFNPILARVIAVWEAFLARHTTALITVGRQVERDLIARGVGEPRQFYVIPPGLEQPRHPSRDSARASLSLSRSAPIVSYVGRLTAIKRPDRLLETVANIRRAVPDVLCIVAGGGDLEATTRDAARDSALPVEFLGWRADIGTVFAASDVTLVTSDNEGTPLAIIEAGLCGVAAVAADVGAVSEVIKDDQTGLLAAPDSSALADAAIRVLSEPNLRSRLAQTAQTDYAERFSCERFVRDHRDLYVSLNR